MNRATLVLEDGTILEGQAFGASADAVFELVFNTSMTGYQEILTDPSYRGQAVLFTCPHIGNVGHQPGGLRIRRGRRFRPPWCARSARSFPTGARSSRSRNGWPSTACPGISGVDTRWLTRKLRDGGTQKAALSTQGTARRETARDGARLARARWARHGQRGFLSRRRMRGRRCRAAPGWRGERPGSMKGKHIVAYDFGIKTQHPPSLGGGWGAKSPWSRRTRRRKKRSH